MSTLPGPLSLSSGFPFVGRESELVTLRSLVPWAPGEGRRIALVGGEAGSGKSRLVREFAGEAAESGANVLYGACDAVVHPPYGPFVEALGELRAGTGAATRPRHRAPSPAHRGGRPAGAHRPRAARVLVLEDAHWADAPTLGLLRHLARAGGRARLLLVATFRDTETDMPDALSEMLADLRRSDDVVRLRLGGLSGDDVTEFVRRVAGEEPVPELAPAIADMTGGNPFLVCELWRSLVDGGGVEIWGGCVRLTRPLEELAPPESVREVVARRLARLRPATADLLELAATAGSEFELEVLRQVADADLLPALEEAVSSGMIEELPSRGLAYRFTHELVRRSLYDGLSAVRRAELHLRVGEALERSGARSVADLAHHFAAAAPFGGVGARRRVQRARRAGGERGPRLRRRGGAARRRARARRRRSRRSAPGCCSSSGPPGTAPAAPSTRFGVRRGGELADGLGDAELLARAAIGYEEACWRPGITDQLAVGLLERGGRRRSATSRRSFGSACSAASPARSRSAGARARRAGPRRRGGDGAAARRPPRARPRAGGELLGPWDALARRRSSRCSPRRATSPSRSATSSCGPRR